jgi:hypothetical protein
MLDISVGMGRCLPFEVRPEGRAAHLTAARLLARSQDKSQGDG